jgi:hypothetical protein
LILLKKSAEMKDKYLLSLIFVLLFYIFPSFLFAQTAVQIYPPRPVSGSPELSWRVDRCWMNNPDSCDCSNDRPVYKDDWAVYQHQQLCSYQGMFWHVREESSCPPGCTHVHTIGQTVTVPDNICSIHHIYFEQAFNKNHTMWNGQAYTGDLRIRRNGPGGEQLKQDSISINEGGWGYIFYPGNGVVVNPGERIYVSLWGPTFTVNDLTTVLWNPVNKYNRGDNTGPYAGGEAYYEHGIDTRADISFMHVRGLTCPAKTCSISTNTISIAEGSSLTATTRGTGNKASGEPARLWLEKWPNSTAISTPPTGAVSYTAADGKVYYLLGECTSSNMSECSFSRTVDNLPRGVIICTVIFLLSHQSLNVQAILIVLMKE